MLEPDTLSSHLDTIAVHVDECRAACEVARSGDPTALAEVAAVVDAMATEVAALKAACAPPAGMG